MEIADILQAKIIRATQCHNDSIYSHQVGDLQKEHRLNMITDTPRRLTFHWVLAIDDILSSFEADPFLSFRPPTSELLGPVFLPNACLAYQANGAMVYFSKKSLFRRDIIASYLASHQV